MWNFLLVPDVHLHMEISGLFFTLFSFFLLNSKIVAPFCSVLVLLVCFPFLLYCKIVFRNLLYYAWKCTWIHFILDLFIPIVHKWRPLSHKTVVTLLSISLDCNTLFNGAMLHALCNHSLEKHVPYLPVIWHGHSCCCYV